jgi:DNA ligase-1
MKPQLANDADIPTLPYPDVYALPKIDGVRAMNLGGTLTGRSLDPFKGVGVTEYFSRPDFVGLDGEMTLGASPVAPRLCSLTTGALGRFKGVSEMADFHWHIFDVVTAETVGMCYAERYELAERRVHSLGHERIHLVPFEVVTGAAHANRLIDEHLDSGFEGTIFRNAKAPAKQGRPGKKTQEFVRYKPWIDSEMLCTGITEGATNTNEAKTNTLGRTERSFAKDGLVPNGMIGSIQGRLLEDIVSPLTGKVLFPKGHVGTIGTGEMTEEEAAAWFKDQTQIVGHLIKFKHLAYGIKDNFRMGTFLSKRLPQDMVK